MGYGEILTQKLAQFYARGELSKWQERENISNPGYVNKFYESLKQYDILPKNPDGMVFVSVSANRAGKEVELAKLLDKETSGGLSKKPQLIAADFAGTQTDVGFEPIFDLTEKPQTKNIDFTFVSAKASEFPLASHTVDTLWDRLGATWYAASDKEFLRKLLKEYKRLIKQEGKIVMDAHVMPEIGKTAVEKLKNESVEDFFHKTRSTYDVLHDNLGSFVEYDKLAEFLEQLDMCYKLVGDGDGRLLIIENLKDKSHD